MVGSLLFVAAVALVVLVLAIWSTEKPLVDADLLPEHVQVSEEGNALSTLATVTNKLYWPDELQDRLGELISDQNWDDSLASEVLEKNPACLAWFAQSFDRQLVFPSPTGS